MERSEGDSTQTYFWDGNVISYEANGERNYYLQDELGSPIRIEDEAGKTRETYGYGAFREDLYGNQGELQPFGYTGYQIDTVAGTYYTQAREYQPDVGRFQEMDLIKGVVVNPQTQNIYKYCMGNPFRYIDPTGCSEECIDNIEEIIQEFLSDNVYGLVTDGLDITLTGVGTYLKKAIIESIRPNNIGRGIWKKQMASELDDVARIFGSSSDDVVRGFANAEVKGFFPKVIEKLGYVGVAIDAVLGIQENIEEGSSWQKTVSDATVDVAISGGTLLAAGYAGAGIGAIAGSVVPGAGNVIGAVGGFIVGIGCYVVTDVIKINEKSIRDTIKDGISGFFGWE